MGCHALQRAGFPLAIAAIAAGLCITGPIAAEGSIPGWVLSKPGPNTQLQKSVVERGGVNPCATPDPGFANYHAWSRDVSMGQMLVPSQPPQTAFVDVMIHFHGHEAARKAWVESMQTPVFVGIDLGTGSGAYEEAFSVPGALQKLVDSVLRGVAARYRVPQIQLRHLGVSAWSAGYGAIDRILRTEYGRTRVDSVILLDGLHSGYSLGSLNSAQLDPFAAFAQRAALGQRFMFVTHSSIIPPGYASTTETANYLIFRVGGKPIATRPRGSDPFGLDLISLYIKNGFHVRGYSGNDRMDHCAHLGLLRDVVRVHLKPRWRQRPL